MTEIADVQALLKSNRDHLLKRGNVVATGIGYKTTANNKTSQLSVICSVTEKKSRSRVPAVDLIPHEIDGIPTDVIQTGRIRALQLPTERHRPAPGGVSIGHFEITAGTLGCLVKKGGQVMILSNNHVMANSNAAKIGDPILQPGTHDGGKNPEDHIANLEAFEPIQFSGGSSNCPIAMKTVSVLNGLSSLFERNTRFKAITLAETDNLIDAAIAKPLKVTDVKDEILNIGAIDGVGTADLGMAIKKSGRTTGFTTGEILQVDVTVNVQYGGGKIARFVDQFMAGPMSQGGDSGSAVLNESNQLVGLLFAGSDQTTIVNRIQNVFSVLGVSL